MSDTPNFIWNRMMTVRKQAMVVRKDSEGNDVSVQEEGIANMTLKEILSEPEGVDHMAILESVRVVVLQSILIAEAQVAQAAANAKSPVDENEK